MAKQEVKKRKDTKGRNLKDGEMQLPDGRYKYQYIDAKGARKAVYSWKLLPTDRIPAGKRDSLSLREKEEEIAADNRDGIDGKAAGKITLNQMFEIYMSGKVNLKQSTRTNYLYMYQNYIYDTIGTRALKSIKYSDIIQFYNALIQEKGFKPNSMEIIHTILHPTFTLAVRDGYIRTNPTEGVMADIKKSHNWEKPKRHALTVVEQSLLICFLSQSEMYGHWLPMITTFLGTGCRVGELIGLRWQDIDFKNGTISINHNLIYRQQDNGHMELHVTTPKTSAGCRTIPLLKEVREALQQERIKQLQTGGKSVTVDGYTGFIFTNRFGDVYTPMSINRAIDRIILAANAWEAERAAEELRTPVVIRHFSVHNLRHTFCTRFCENETNIKVIQEIMGHSDITTTMNIYAEATEQKKKEAFINLEGKIKIS